MYNFLSTAVEVSNPQFNPTALLKMFFYPHHAAETE